ncbi:hypothetical protein [Clostridium drakei]|uniref:Uncharacterized protein n=1 Tax=Clostridium drakei TaxID=332101 RepID=A0A2U8DX80_9CLOT|nr:hypothetical protein [Clostridium drakei]AWI06652.1 hypothetical protein B9W14_19865 [Clostridium drakei]
MNSLQSLNFDAKRCGACIFWQGERIICKCEVKYDESSVGKCNNPDSPAYGRGMPVVLSCFSKKDIK